MKKKIYILLLSGCIALSTVVFSGCSKETSAKEKTALSSETDDLFSSQTDLFGGGMVCNATLLSGEIDEEFSYELPVLSSKKLNNIELEEMHISGEGNYSVKWDHVSTGDLYKGWYYYYIHLKVSASQESKAVFSIDSLDLNIDGVSCRYTPKSLVFYNTEGFFGKNVPDDGGILLYTDSPDVLFPEIPSDPKHPAAISLEVNKDCTLKNIFSLDFVDITNVICKVNGSSQEFSAQEGLALKKNDTLEISYCLAYQDGYSQTDLIKTSRILQYTDSNGNEYILNEPQGFLLIGIENDRMIHAYIDQEILGDA